MGRRDRERKERVMAGLELPHAEKVRMKAGPAPQPKKQRLVTPKQQSAVDKAVTEFMGKKFGKKGGLYVPK